MNQTFSDKDQVTITHVDYPNHTDIVNVLFDAINEDQTILQFATRLCHYNHPVCDYIIDILPELLDEFNSSKFIDVKNEQKKVVDTICLYCIENFQSHQNLEKNLED